MIRLSNIENNVLIDITLLKTELLDISSERGDDVENWIPFILDVTSPTMKIHLEEEIGATFTLYELKVLIMSLKNLVIKNVDETFRFYCYESYFEIVFDYIKEDNCYSIDFWVNIGSTTNGRIYGYDQGIRFVANEEAVVKFINSLENEMKLLLGD